LKWAPEGIHDWENFLKPHEVGLMLKNCGFKVLDIQGYTFLPLKQKWDFCKSKQVNYFITGELM
jgi:2-polyprenyl-3-methyl-5-hydroxy-6-metoxy-1,4-benzoquinol methylase